MMMYGPRRMMGAPIACLLGAAAVSGDNEFLFGLASVTRREADSAIRAVGMIGYSLQV
jgi:hypothetical protein